MAEKILTKAEAEKMFRVWKKRLRLDSWDIDFRWKMRASEMSEKDSMGCTITNFIGRQAVVQMLDPVDFDNCRFQYDYEKTLVHELLHLRVLALDDSGDPLHDKLLHQLVDDMAKALVSAEREGSAC